MASELDHAIAAVQRLIPLVDELAGLGCTVEVMISVDGHTVEIAAPRRAVRASDEVDQGQCPSAPEGGRPLQSAAAQTAATLGGDLAPLEHRSIADEVDEAQSTGLTFVCSHGVPVDQCPDKAAHHAYPRPTADEVDQAQQ